MASHVPTRLRASLRKEGVTAWNVFLRMDLVEFVSGATALIRNGK